MFDAGLAVRVQLAGSSQQGIFQFEQLAALLVLAVQRQGVHDGLGLGAGSAGVYQGLSVQLRDVCSLHGVVVVAHKLVELQLLFVPDQEAALVADLQAHLIYLRCQVAQTTLFAQLPGCLADLLQARALLLQSSRVGLLVHLVDKADNVEGGGVRQTIIFPCFETGQLNGIQHIRHLWALGEGSTHGGGAGTSTPSLFDSCNQRSYATALLAKIGYLCAVDSSGM
mmetsp:Transcript_5599/g.8709  ORF Transcript_5599/g.8709 Transcript_5599/m.8709 type:complete len:225 (-) Transcript_5599:243-917(-)